MLCKRGWETRSNGAEMTQNEYPIYKLGTLSLGGREERPNDFHVFFFSIVFIGINTIPVKSSLVDRGNSDIRISWICKSWTFCSWRMTMIDPLKCFKLCLNVLPLSANLRIGFW
eukprot:c9846_g1_i1.p1 GENE.c9846_g1_i1~~c9846_g1_i1.p1  ORF type:complete len:114 (+),score=14.67 c9846_g1_i1:354-695(+)